MSDFRVLINETARAMSTPILLRVRDDTIKLLTFARDRKDYAAASFFDIAIEHMSAELDRREKAKGTIS